MSDKDRYSDFFNGKKYKVLNGSLAPKAVLSFIILLSAMIVVVVFLIGKYTDEVNKTSSGNLTEAKKVGNWEFPDGDYILKQNEIFAVGGREVGAATIRDNKNGNKMIVFETEFSLPELSRIKEETLNALLSRYGLGDSYFKGTGTTGRYGQEIKYNIVGWKSVIGENIGIIGNIDCPLENGNKSSIFLIALNAIDKYDNNRVLEFANALNCPDVNNSNNNNTVEDKLDTDNDGLTDKVEKMLHSDPYNSDTDGDGTNDGNEIKDGRNPLMHKQWQDAFTAEDFDKVKRDIKFISIYNYDKLFPEK